MKVNPLLFGVIVLLIFMGMIMTAQAAGVWTTSGKVSASGEKVTATGQNTEEVKGWMEIGDVSDAYKVPLAEIVEAFGLPPDTAPDTQLKELESDRFEIPALRKWLQEHANP